MSNTCITDRLTTDGIYKLLEKGKDFNISVLDETYSTNAFLKKIAESGGTEGTVVIADSQTGGRGRFTRKFYSPKNCGIYMSILLKPSLASADAVLITAAAATAVAEAIEAVSGKKASIKWVNDIFLNSKKVCGILTEGCLATKNGGFNWAVLGIGINVYEPQNGFDDEIKDIAGAVFKEKQNGLRNRLAAEILNIFSEYYKVLETKSFLNGYRNRSFVIGNRINVIKADKKIPALALGIDDKCQLLVEYDDKSREWLCSGEISIKL